MLPLHCALEWKLHFKKLPALMTTKPFMYQWSVLKKAAELFRNSRTASVLTIILHHSMLSTEINVDSTSEAFE